MVLEKLLLKYRTNFLLLFFFSSIATLISVYISYLIFEKYNSLFIVFLISFLLIPLIEKFRRENLKNDYKTFFERNFETFFSYIIVIFGISIPLSLLFYFLPVEISEKIFLEQINAIKKITGNFAIENTFFKIFLNNIQVALLAFLLSFFYGFGGVLVISWNASILGTAIGILTKSYGIQYYPFAILTFLPHGIFEFFAFFLAALAGSIFSSYYYKKEKTLIFDSFKIFFFSIFLIFIGALIETFIILLK